MFPEYLSMLSSWVGCWFSVSSLSSLLSCLFTCYLVLNCSSKRPAGLSITGRLFILSDLTLLLCFYLFKVVQLLFLCIAFTYILEICIYQSKNLVFEPLSGSDLQCIPYMITTVHRTLLFLHLISTCHNSPTCLPWTTSLRSLLTNKGRRELVAATQISSAIQGSTVPPLTTNTSSSHKSLGGEMTSTTRRLLNNFHVL